MPESHEEHAHHYVFQKNFMELLKTTSFWLLSLHADASKREKLNIMQKMDTLFPLIQIAIWCEEVERIRHICSLQPLPKIPKFQIPPLWLHWYYKDLIPWVGQSSLTLAIIFSRWVNYGTYTIQVKIKINGLALKIAYLMHTSIQFYSREQWETLVLSINKKVSYWRFSWVLIISFQLPGPWIPCQNCAGV